MTGALGAKTSPNNPIGHPDQPTRPGGRFVDLVWLTWRQHRGMLVGTAMAAVVFAGYLLSLRGLSLGHGLPGFSQQQTVRVALTLVSVLGAVIAVFWAAPLLAREYEQQTHLLAWTQDVPRNRWLLAKVGLLSAAAVALSAVLGTAASLLITRVNEQSAGPSGFYSLDSTVFEAWWPLQAGYALFGLALGLAVSVLMRRNVIAMGTTLVGYVAVRVLIASVARPYFLPPLRHIVPVDSGDLMGIVFATNGSETDFGYLDAAGAEVPSPLDCLTTAGGPACLRSHGITQRLLTYQPGSRTPLFHLIELAIFLLLAALLFGIAARRVRRQTVL